MIGWLEIVYPDGRHERVPVDRLPYHIGRYHSNHLIISEPYVSRFHCSIIREGDQIVIRDLESKSGTWVNGRRVDSHPLQDGDLIKLHPATHLQLRFRRHSTSVSGKKTEIEQAEDQFQAINWLIKNIRSLQSQTVLREISRTLIKAAVELVDADYGMVIVRDGDDWRITAMMGPQGYIDDHHSFTYSRTIVQRTIETLQPVMDIWSPEDESGHPSASMSHLNIHNVICIPLLEPATVDESAHTRVFHRPQLRGIMYLDRRRPGMRFQQSDLNVLMTLSEEAVRSLTFARLYRQVAEQEQLERELKWARRVQQRFLPEMPYPFRFVTVDAFMIPSRSVGGDYYTVLPRGDSALLVGVGDISGKGIDAALLMSLCQGALHALVSARAPLDQIVATLNRILRQYTETSRYTTLCLMEIRETGEIDYVNAGHPPAIWFRADGTHVMLEATGPILGILDRIPRIERIHVSPGDLVLIFSDGLYERVGQGEVWDYQKWMAWIKQHLEGRAETVCQRVRTAVEAWTKESYQADDITFLAFSFEGRFS